MRTAIVTALSAIAVFILGYAATYNVTPPTPDTVAVTAAETASPDAPDVTEGPDKGITLAADDKVSAGVCRTYVGAITITQCAPLYSPSGAVLAGRVEEDGSARYTDGFVFGSVATTTAPIAVSYETAPSDLWDALIAQGYTGDPNDGREALYVNPGTVIDTPGRTYTATAAGWLVCEDWTTTGAECSA